MVKEHPCSRRILHDITSIERNTSTPEAMTTIHQKTNLDNDTTICAPTSMSNQSTAISSSAMEPSTTRAIMPSINMESSNLAQSTSNYKTNDDATSALTQCDEGCGAVQVPEEHSHKFQEEDQKEGEGKGDDASLVQLKTKDKAMNFTTFHPFPRLPIELRLKIWKYALPRASTINFAGSWYTKTFR
ncbi:hypothetical protein BDZ45DRAFT_693695 [Acephala macrosclerotiorum]|nr:hypothetical protein BDZ45DRAFT_693695 [Acephala macrosclerotiorum]